jgi:hypothetical protein
MRVGAVRLAMTSIVFLAGCAADAEQADTDGANAETSTREASREASKVPEVLESDTVAPLTGSPNTVGASDSTDPAHILRPRWPSEE